MGFSGLSSPEPFRHYLEDQLSLPKRATCDSAEQEHEKVSKVGLWGPDTLTFHHLGLIISATCGAIAITVAVALIWLHIKHYLKPYEQKHIVRILVMIPIYALISFLSYLHYHHAVYYEVIRDCYEAFAIASFFTLMCHYIAPNLHEQKQYFRDIELKNWVWPLNWCQKCSGGDRKGWLRKPRSGLTWFNIVWIGIFQYCFVRPFFTIIAVITQANGKYCQSSKDPRFAYIWVAGFEGISVTIAMYCLVQFYIQLKSDLAPHKPFLKITCIKLVIFFCFWQSWIISLLTTKSGPIKQTEKVSGADWRIGLPSMLVCFEMMIFAVMHHFAFPWKPYDLKRQGLPDTLDEPKHYAGGPIHAVIDALNPWDIIKAFGRGTRWLFVGVRHRQEDVSYQTKLEPLPTAYNGPAYTGNGELATEMVKTSHTASNKKHGNGSEDSDTAGLLYHANSFGAQDSYLASPPHGSHSTSARYERSEDELPAAPTPGEAYRVGPSAYQDVDIGRNQGQGRDEWDMFGGVRREGRPPEKGQ